MYQRNIGMNNRWIVLYYTVPYTRVTTRMIGFDVCKKYKFAKTPLYNKQRDKKLRDSQE